LRRRGLNYESCSFSSSGCAQHARLLTKRGRDFDRRV
jgi:hypothetical protein